MNGNTNDASGQARIEGLRICLVGPAPPPSGGMALQTEQLADLLIQAGARVDRVITNAPYPFTWVAGVPILRAIFRLVPYGWALWRAARRNELMHLMANSGWSWHLFAAPAIWIAWLRGLPVVVNYRGGEAKAFLERAAQMVRPSLKRAAAVVVPSGYLVEVFAKHGFAARVVPNIINLDRFHPRRVGICEVDALPRCRVLLVARNLESIYDNATAINAFAQLANRHADLELHLAGTGPELSKLKDLVAKHRLDGRVRFLGRLDRQRMAQCLREASVALNPATADNMPNSLLEAMASGVPIVSTDVGGIPHMVAHGKTALLVPPSQPDAMAAEIERLLSDQDLRQRLVEQALAEVQRYTWEGVRPFLFDEYEQVKSRRPFQSIRLAKRASLGANGKVQ